MLLGLCAKYTALLRHSSYTSHDRRSRMLSQGPALLRALHLKLGRLGDESQRRPAPSQGRLVIAAGAASTADPGRLPIARGRADFSLPSSFVRLRRGERLYQEGERVEALFHIVTGVVKVHTTFLDGKQHIMSFSFPDDLIGFAPNCTHVGSARRSPQ